MTGLLVIAVIIVIVFALVGILGLVWELQERRRLMRLLREKGPSLAALDIPALNEALRALERNHDAHYSSYRASILDTSGRAMNICPLCGAYLCVEKPPARSGYYRHTPVPPKPGALICTKSPTCNYRKDLSDAAGLALKS